MRPSYDFILSLLESEPNIQAAEQMAGVTAAQAAAGIMRKLDSLPDQRQRDAYLSNRMAPLGVYVSGVEDFNRRSEEILDRTLRRDTFDREVRRLSEQSQNTPEPFSPERLAYIANRMQKARLTQGLGDRLRERDSYAARNDSPILPPNERVRASRDDSRDRRAAIHAAISSTSDEYGIELTGEHANLRDTLSAAFAAHEHVAAQNDPLESEGLRDMSNAV